VGSSISLDDVSFHKACRVSDVERVRKLLPAMTYEKINRQDFDGNTPLHSACEGNNKEIVSLLFDERDLC
jgi:hypothetical protein